tara:strand:+ start:430 stop:714 length:285 start_codon:yes stop_codon:yes gene_type:complete
MALTKSTEDDKIEIVGEYKHIQIRTATIIKEDGVELSRKFSRRVLRSGTLDASDNFVDTDISSESAEIQSICNGVWSTTAKDAWKAKMIASKAS